MAEGAELEQPATKKATPTEEDVMVVDAAPKLGFRWLHAEKQYKLTLLEEHRFGGGSARRGARIRCCHHGHG